MHSRFKNARKMAQESYTKTNEDEPLSMHDLESDTIAKQRKELQLLIGELQDRDRELNDMVAAHQQQLSSWERDRRKLVTVEQRSEKMEMEIRKRNEQLRLLIQRLKVSDTKNRSKDEALDSLQNKLKKAECEASEAKALSQGLQTQNDVLNTSMSDLNCRINSLETKEQQFITQLQLKEGDLVGAESQISELNSKLRRVDTELSECKRNGAAAHANLEEQRAKYRHCQGELDKTIAEMATKTSDLISLRQEVAILRDESQSMKKDLYLGEEQIRRKEDLLSLQKSKQDRTDVELAALRELYERQQQELACLQLNLSNSQEMLSKQEERLNTIRFSNEQSTEIPPSISEYDIVESNEFMLCLEEIRNNVNSLKDVFDKLFPLDNEKSLTLPKDLCPSHLRRALAEEYKQDSYLFAVYLQENSLNNSLSRRNKCEHWLSETPLTDHQQLNPDTADKTSKGCYSGEDKIQHREINMSAIKNSPQCGLEFDGFDNSSQTTNDLLDEARRSTEEDSFAFLRSSPRCRTPKCTSPSQLRDGSYSPTSKLQRLLNESRDMVQCLETQAALPTKPYSSRHNRHTY